MFNVFIFSTFGQNIDSLRKELSQTYNLHERGKILYELSKQLMRIDLIQSTKYVEEGITLWKAEDIPTSELGDFYHLRGNIYNTQGFLIEAENSYREAISIFTENRNWEKRIKSRQNLGVVFVGKSEFQEAIKVFEDILKESQEHLSFDKYELVQAYTYLNLGNMYDKMDDSEKAIQSLNQSINKGAKVLQIKCKALHNLSNQYIKLNRWKDAELSINESIIIKKQINDKEGLVNSYMVKSNILYHRGLIVEAKLLNEQSLEIASKLKSPKLLKNINKNLAYFYEETNDYKNANYYLIEYLKYAEQLLTTDYSKRVEYLKNRLELENQKKILMEEKESQQIIITILFIVLFLLIMAVILVYKNRTLSLAHQKSLAESIKVKYELNATENEKLQVEIDFKDRELTTNIMHLMQKNELINKVSEDLMNLYEDVDDLKKKQLRSIVYDLQNEHQNELWKELELRFEQINASFYNKLYQDYPNLTPSDKKLCAYLYLNLTTKEISNITHQSTKTIEVARSRLRKKLNITNSDIDFQTFFNQLV